MRLACQRSTGSTGSDRMPSSPTTSAARRVWSASCLAARPLVGLAPGQTRWKGVAHAEMSGEAPEGPSGSRLPSRFAPGRTPPAQCSICSGRPNEASADRCRPTATTLQSMRGCSPGPRRGSADCSYRSYIHDGRKRQVRVQFGRPALTSETASSVAATVSQSTLPTRWRSMSRIHCACSTIMNTTVPAARSSSPRTAAWRLATRSSDRGPHAPQTIRRSRRRAQSIDSPTESPSHVGAQQTTRRVSRCLTSIAV